MGTADGAKARPGIFITFEGGEGAGKTTHLNFLAASLRGLGHDVVCLREPGGTPIGENLRKVVLDAGNSEMCDQAELLIYEAARAQIVRQAILPALERGQVVLCDRFTDSTIAYQAYGRGLERRFVEQANEFACQGVHPDRTVMLSTGEGERCAMEGLARATKHGDADRLEQAGLAFHAKVNQGFRELAAANPARIRVVSSDMAKDQTARAVFLAVADLFGWDDDVDARFAPGFFEAINEVDTNRKAVVDQGAVTCGPQAEGTR